MLSSIIALSVASVVYAQGPSELPTQVNSNQISQSNQNSAKDLLSKAFSDLKQDIERTKNRDFKKTTELLDTHILSVIDSGYMARFAAGPLYRAADENIRKKYQESFNILLIKAYSSQLDNISQVKVSFFENKSNEQDKSRVSSIIELDSNKVSIQYELRKNKENNWKVIDVIIEDLSLLQAYKSQFNAVQAKSLSELTEFIENINNKQ